MRRTEETLARLVELTPEDGWREMVASDAKGDIITRYRAREEHWDEVIVDMLASRVIREREVASGPLASPRPQRPADVAPAREPGAYPHLRVL